MPLFFFLAGFFIKYELNTKEFIMADFKRLMIPYLFFAVIALLVESIKRILLSREGLNYIHEFEGILVWMDYPSLMNTYGFVLWFLPSLFFGRLIIFIIHKNIKPILIQSTAVIILFYISFYVDIVLGIDNAFNAVIYIFIGSITYKYYMNYRHLYISIIILIILISTYGVPNLDIANKSYQNIFLNILFALSMIFMILTFKEKLNFTSSLLNLWGCNTMILFVVHPYTNNVAHLVVEYINIGDWVLKLFITLALLQGLLLIKKKYNNKGVFKYV